jgi:hypothetical protein
MTRTSPYPNWQELPRTIAIAIVVEVLSPNIFERY